MMCARDRDRKNLYLAYTMNAHSAYSQSGCLHSFCSPKIVGEIPVKNGGCTAVQYVHIVMSEINGDLLHHA